MKLSVVIPVFNEAENVLPLLQEIQSALASATAYEIIFVDDGSDDATPAILQDALSKIPALRVIRHAHSCGQSRALHSGISAAKYPCIATLDGDGQNDPADIMHLCAVFTQLSQIDPQVWMIAGWRKHRHDSAWRKISSKVANFVRGNLLGDNTPDTGCGLKLVLRDQFLMLPYFDHMHRFLPALILRAGGRVHSEPVNHRPRINGHSKYGTLDRLAAGIIDLMGVLWLKKRSRQVLAMEVRSE
ncbi:MAG: glycosyltransferase family 2 protein [Methylicorpusculum sp.]|uniref:glycosyltransferase family 2 protein n=1 Tax=Methylicorpusculum sp. TaxID=2713644 RepID=UPI00271BE926|nr:glycosyltransferase family 2 protein [Methylicorpusculum sp.]MDO8940836.1 glycosyltransferase family 2 protein [Methylicorpusculum sp.]MDP2179554.1 glycosyltransferase family 2 protein [Methylicorpusculum sp.]MDP2204400.1 glycosyltransferase family 2 protein [Methylicorpusculum sp.]MDP3527677.1 glycosyltransferase family 2 protein [Methylicorpusculum sp.]MDZ4154576.1 glycosyltransferase family 2 protein [Methylicorpusculum sp.]